MSVAIKIENVSKLYRLGTVGTGTLSHDLNRWWHKIGGKEDPYAKVGEVNDRTKRAKSEEQGAESDEADASLRSLPSALRSTPASLSSSPSALRSLSSPSALRSSPDYIWALRDINLEVKQGEILGIIGHKRGEGWETIGASVYFR